MIKEYAQLYKTELTELVMPFWLKNSVDHTFGGFFSCLDRKGNIYDTDKFVWLQARQVWTFSMLFNKGVLGQEYLDEAISGANFLIDNAIDNEGNWFFSMDREGHPLIAPYNIFSDCFGALALNEIYKATKVEKYKKLSLQTFNNILSRRNNPKGKFNKSISDTRQLVGFALPMILCNLCYELKDILNDKITLELTNDLKNMIFKTFLNTEKGVIHENVNSDGTFSNTFEGRLINPGHGIEAMWFIMDLAKQNNDYETISKAMSIVYTTLDYAWDKKHGGLYYFMDIKRYPLSQLEWSQKLWWVHLETLVCLAKGYEYTNDDYSWSWFKKVHDYTWAHFKDNEYPEWYGYLNRKGETLISLKGGKWKGCFHVPRALYNVMNSLEKIQKIKTSQVV